MLSHDMRTMYIYKIEINYYFLITWQMSTGLKTARSAQYAAP